ncbi:MAG TPA: hypothetical protein VFM88_01425 [Vicinamibacteria bacterium]|nr:hypothetical protein [Vicinamibacteria bacterium]
MSSLLVQAMRSFAALILGLAVAMALWFKVLPALGIIGPTTDERIGSAAEAIETARAYGAQAEQEALKAALARLEEARRLAAAGQGLKARRAALLARAAAVEAQRSALVSREEDRRRARRIVDEIDGMVNGLEDLHSVLSRGADRAALSRMLTVMKTARASGAGLFLAFEEGNYGRVLEGEATVKNALERARTDLEAARRAP